MNAFARFFFLSCYQATALVEKKEAGLLSFWEKYRLAVHTKHCEVCKQYELQSYWLSQQIRLLLQNKKEKTLHNQALKEKLLLKIKNW